VRIRDGTAGLKGGLRMTMGAPVDRIETGHSFCLSTKKMSGSDEPPVDAAVCVVDDDAMIRKLMSRSFVRMKLSVVTFESGEAIVQQIQSGYTYGLILMDNNMSGWSGKETIMKIRRYGYTHPIIALSGDCLTEARDQALGAGANAYAGVLCDVTVLLTSNRMYIYVCVFAHSETHWPEANGGSRYRLRFA
jgi:CheY-like chemotaxis protein